MSMFIRRFTKGYNRNLRQLGSSVNVVRFQSSKKIATNDNLLRLIASIAGCFTLGTTVGYFVIRECGLGHCKAQRFLEKSTVSLREIDTPHYGSSEDLEKCIQDISKFIGDSKVNRTGASISAHIENGYGIDRPYPRPKPRCVIYVESTEDVSHVMKLATKYRIPVVPFSGGTCLEGSTYSTRECIIVDTSKMNRIIEVFPNDLDAIVQAGVGWQQLNDYLSKQPGLENLMLGCDCGPGAHIGGMVNTNASGISATRYGSMGVNILSVKAVLPDGTIIKTKRRSRKTSAGYNLTGLLTGSEGTLAIVTEITVKLQVKQNFETVAVVQFPTLSDSVQAVSDLFKKGLQFNAIELLDAKTMECVNMSNQVSRTYDNVPTLFFRIAGINETVVNEYVKELSRTVKLNHSIKIESARTDEEANELFAARKNVLYMMLDYGYNVVGDKAKIWITDFAVPLSSLASTLEEIGELLDAQPINYMTLGHVGDGNFHCDIFYKPDQYELVKNMVDQMNRITMNHEGTCTGEHGIGLNKRDFLEEELSPNTIEFMRKIKLSVDPLRILNPDKILRIDPQDPVDEYMKSIGV